MSEYQYYEWQTVDRLLTEDEQAAVSKLSSHITVSASSAAVEYNYGDFGHSEREVLALYFDAFLYMANWGTRTLAFRFPTGLLDVAGVEPYLHPDWVTLTTDGAVQLLEIQYHDEGGGGWNGEWLEGAGLLAGLVALRSNLLDGDYRCLYLAWLMVAVEEAQYFDADDPAEVKEPPVPAGLGKLTPALKRFAKFFEIDTHLIASAAAASPAAAPGLAQADLRRALAQLPRAEVDDYLMRLLAGEATLGATLRQQLRSKVPAPAPPVANAGRSLAELLAEAANFKRAAQEREAVAAEKRRLAALAKLAQEEPAVWLEVDNLLREPRGTNYAKAAENLERLRELAEHRGTQAAFNQQMQVVKQRHQNKPAFIKRLIAAHLI